jgi:hypothetical protein
MRLPNLRLLLLAALLSLAPSSRAESLIENGSFDDPAEPLKGWITDYEWTGNSWYVGNKKHVAAVAEAERGTVVKLTSPGDAGVKMESRAFPLEPGFRYVCNLDVKGGGYRLYFAGYKWAPGIRPHENPKLEELRLIYQSKATTATAEGWKQEKFELPGVKLSPQAIGHLKEVRFLTVYIWFVKSGFVDNVKVTKVPDPGMNF